ncbi:UNVERIFIED_CONTAM: DnaJsubfamily B member 14 [Sesamum angustifolium]|uniref:DnaJsubfamily B member 14 n=1 Tax=Sesamum angustifolium TaxID=2727405 RepID=A0AAW2IIG0_9LAMI
MECNRDEAVRAKEIAERKFRAKDIKGAKKFALKAQNLYPELEGISQMVTTLEVYISAEEEKIHGESNWYGVLGVTPLADDETIRKQYRKLALLLHPDKNRSIGAEGAFQLVSQAWSLLSDKSHRIAYDQRCGAAFQQRNQTRNEGPPPPAQNGFYNVAKTAVSQMKVPKGNASKRDPSSGPYQSRKKERHTFWTVCHRCKMQYEYLRMYLNHNLLCPNCHEAYFAVEINPPSTKSTKISSHTTNSLHRKSSSEQGSNATRNNSSTQCGTSGFNHSNQSNHNNFQWVPFSESTGAASAVQAANMVQQAYEKVKRERQKAQAAARREEALRRKNLASKRSMGGEFPAHPNAAKRRKGFEDFGTSKEAMKQGNFESGTLHQLLMEKAHEVIHEKLNERGPGTMVRNAAGGSQEELCEPVETKSQFPHNKLNIGTVGFNPDVELIQQMSANVLDPDFHNFDKDRTEKCFGDNQVWAVYDDDDGMPRHYAIIHNVISLNPFKLRMSWLTSVTHSRLGHVSWFSGGSSKTCGEFAIGRAEIRNSVDFFSHNVRWIKRTAKVIEIFPRKGDVWALYRNWSREWNELTEDEVIHKYDMVEVLEDYDEEMGIIVIPLVKVAGFKAVFHQHFDPREIRRIPNEEMSRFSHQVPSRLLTGQEGPKSVKGCRQLDPAAIPLEILEVMSKVEGIEFMETDEDVEVVKEVDYDRNTNTNMVEGIS